MPSYASQGLLLFGMIAVYVLWGAWPRSETCYRCKKRFPLTGNRLCPQCDKDDRLNPRTGPLKPAGSTRSGGWGSWLAYQAGLLAFCMLAGWRSGEYFLGDHLAAPWSSVAMGLTGYAVMSLLLAVVHAPTRRAYAAWAAAALRSIESLDWRAARNAARSEGRVSRSARIVVWSASSFPDVRALEVISAQVGSRFAELTGSRDWPAGSLRILCFPDNDSTQRYLTTIFGSNSAPLAGCCLGRRIVFRPTDGETVHPDRWEYTAAHEMTHFVQLQLLPHMPPWLMEGLAETIARSVRPRNGSVGGFARWLRASRLRGDFLSADRVLGLDYSLLSVILQDWETYAAYAAASAFYVQSELLVRGLLREDRDAFRRFLSSFSRRMDLDRTWKACFRKSPATLLQEMLAEMERPASTPAEPAPEEIRRRIDGDLLPRVRDRRRPAAERHLAIRALGIGGYRHGVEALLEVASDGQDPLKAEALRALENLSGELRGEDAAAWR
jgi:hypothetical protein